MTPAHPPEYQTVTLHAGEQIFVNGALIEADGPCRLRMSQSACIVRSGRQPGYTSVQRAIALLYRGTVRVEGSPETLERERADLLASLNLLVARLRTSGAQAQCTRYVGALAQGDIQTALAALRDLACVAQGSDPARRGMPQMPTGQQLEQIHLAANT